MNATSRSSSEKKKTVVVSKFREFRRKEEFTNDSIILVVLDFYL